MRKTLIPLFLAVPACLCAQSFSGRSAADSIYKSLDIDQVVITGTRTPKLLSKSPVQTEVISRRQIVMTDATDLKDLLQQTIPGIEFSYAGNQQVHMNFNGFGGQSMLVLVDGERLAGETMDDVDFSRLLMNNVDHIEIVRGAASAVYGSNANGGVINIITRRKAKKFGLNVNGRIARHNSQRYGIDLENGGKRWGNTLTAARTSQDNYNVHSADAPVSRVISTIYGDKTWNFQDKVYWTPTDRLRLSGRAGYFFREMKRTPTAPERYRDFSGGLRAQWDMQKAGNINLAYSYDQYDKSDYQTITKLDIRDYSNVQNTFKLLYTLSVGDKGDVLSAGADYMHDYLYNNKLTGLTRKQDSFDAFAQYDWNILSNLEAVGAVRYDYFSDGDISRVTPKLSLRYEPVEGLNIRFGYGMGFRAPTLKEKYYNFDMAGIWNVVGNPDLKSEYSHNHNLSVEYRHGPYVVTAGGYYNKVKDKISTGAPYYPTATSKMPDMPYINFDDYKVYGANVTAQAHWSCGLSARLAYAYVHEDYTKDKEGQRMANAYLPSRSHSGTAHVDWVHQFLNPYTQESCLFSIALDGRYLSSVDNQEFVNYYDVTQGTAKVHYPAYTLWKLSTSYAFGKKKAVKFTLAADNIFNYKPKYYYMNCPLTDGLNVMAGLSIDIDQLF